MMMQMSAVEVFTPGAVVTLPGDGTYIVRDRPASDHKFHLATYPRTALQASTYRSARELFERATEVVYPAEVDSDTIDIVAEEFIRSGLSEARGQLYAVVEQTLKSVEESMRAEEGLGVIHREVGESLRTKEIDIAAIFEEGREAATLTAIRRLRIRAGTRGVEISAEAARATSRRKNPFFSEG